MEALAAALGVTVPVLQFLICFVLTLPCSFLWRFVVGTNNRHAYAALSGAVLSYYSFGVGSNVLVTVPILGSYAAMSYDRKRCGFVTTLCAFTFLISCHLYYLSGDAWKNGGIDSTGALMVLTLKVSSAAMNYQDGLLKEEDLRDIQKKNRLLELPSLLTYLGYCLNCGSHLAGPVFEITDYIDWTEDKGLWELNQAQPPPSPYGPAFSSFVKALFCMGMFVYLSPFVPLTWFSDPGYIEWGFWRRAGYQMMCAFVTRFKYYFIWSISETSLVLSGFGFSGWKDSQPKWNRAVNVEILKVELATSAAELPSYWNISVSTWLRHYVYSRLVPKGKKPGFWQLLVTQVFSAVWHGLYAGYLLFFMNSAIMIAGSRALYRWQRALPDGAEFARNVFSILGFAYTSFVLNTTSIGFMVLGLRETLDVYSSVYYAGSLVALVLTICGSLYQPKKSPRASPSSAIASAASSSKPKKLE